MAEFTVNLENLTELERTQLLGLIKKANVDKSWIPAEGEEFWYVCMTNVIKTYKKFTKHHSELIKYGNYFKTPQEAYDIVKRNEVLEDLKLFAKENNYEEIDLFNNKVAYSVSCTRDKDIVPCVLSCRVAADLILFNNYDIAQAAIDAVGADRIKKYVFGIKESKT